MFGNPEDIASKPIAQHFLEHLILDLTVAPANRLLILVQTQPGTNEAIADEKKLALQGIKSFARQIYHQEGIPGFWKGCVFDIIKNGIFRVFHSVFLHLYEPLLNVEDKTRGGFKTVSLEFLLFCAVGASLQAIQHPFKVMRVRLAALETPMDPEAPRGFRKISHCMRRIWNEDGFKGFYRGFGVALLESITNAVCISVQRMIAHQFVAISSEDTSFWGKLKDVCSERSTGSVISAAMTVTSAGQNIRKKLRTIVFQFGRYLGNLLVLYPFRVIQRRVIMHKDPWKVKQPSVRELVKEIWRREGMGGLYSGLTTQILLDTGISAVSPLIARLASAALPEPIKAAVPSVGDINAPVENKIDEIKDTTVEQVSNIAEKVGETLKDTAVVEKIKDLTGKTEK